MRRVWIVLSILLFCFSALFFSIRRAPDVSVSLIDRDREYPEPAITIENHSDRSVAILCFAERTETNRWVQELDLDLDGDSKAYDDLRKSSVLRIGANSHLRVPWSKAVWQNAAPHSGTYRIGIYFVDTSGHRISRFPLLTSFQGRFPGLIPGVYSSPMKIVSGVTKNSILIPPMDKNPTDSVVK